MKKILIPFLIILASILEANSQILVNPTPRTPVIGFSRKAIQDWDLWATRTFKLPYLASTTPVVNTTDSAGSNVQLLSNGNLAISMGLSAGFRQYVPSTVLATTYAPITLGTGYIQNGTGLQASSNYNISGTGQAARIGIGGAPATTAGLYNQYNLTGSSTAYLSLNSTVIQSVVTTAAYGSRIFMGTAASSFTLANIYYNSVTQNAFGAGSSVTTQQGYYVDNTLVGATNNYGFRGDLSANSNKWNLYMSGTAKNYLEGNLGIGVPTALAYLHLKGGTATSNTAPIKFTNGTLLGAPENGTIEYDGTNFYGTPSATTRKTFAYTVDITNERSASATLTNKTLTTPILTGYTVSTLPSGTLGMTAYVTDATAPTYLGALTGGGSVRCPVFYNGTAWVSH